MATLTPQQHTLKSEQTHQQSLCEALEALPTELNLTPVKGKKPYLPDWQKLVVTHGQIGHQILANGATGYGLLTGNGLVAIDADGPLADTKLNELSRGELPQTPSWASGKLSCSQRLYRLSRPLQAVLDKTEFTRHYIDCGNGQQLDFRYDRCQSVLPPSLHPETGQYRWIRSFSDCDITTAPDWLESLLLEWALEKLQRPATVSTTPRPIHKEDRKTTGQVPNQQWGNREAPGRIPQNSDLMLRWNQTHITGKGQTNSVLLEFCRLIKESGVDCETAIAEFRHFAPQIPGYHQYASKTSKRDLEDGTWAERIVVNWFKRDGYSGHVAKRNTDLNQIRQDAAIKRISEAVSEGINQELAKVGEWIEWIQSYCYRKWGIKTGLKTLYRHLELWHPKYRNKTHPPTPRVELRPGVKDSITARDTQHFTLFLKTNPQITLWALITMAAVAAPKPKQETSQQRGHDPTETATPTKFRKGDRVIVDDRTALPYCGRECTIKAVLPDGTYRLDVTYTGKRLGLRQRKNAVEALPSFLRHADVTQDNSGTKPDNPIEVWVSAADIQRLKIPDSHWLHAICGAAKQRIKAYEVEHSIWQQLLSVGDNA